MVDNQTSIHGCALVLDTVGLIIRGASGSGKSELARSLIERWHGNNRYACWVADDRVLLKNVGRKLLAAPAPAIAGRAEHRFLGICNVAYLAQATVDHVVDLVSPDQMQRMPEKQSVRLVEQGPQMTLFQVPALSTAVACNLVAALLQSDCSLDC